MFRIRIDVTRVSLTGLQALDERRRLKLPDGVSLTVARDAVASADVGEGTARAYFGPTQTHHTVEVPLALLTPDDVAPVYDAVTLRADLPAERVLELWRTQAERNRAE